MELVLFEPPKEELLLLFDEADMLLPDDVPLLPYDEPVEPEPPVEEVLFDMPSDELLV